MKPVTTIVTILFMGISAAHLLRVIFQVDIIIGGFIIPVWVSIFGFIIPLVLAILLDRENKKELIKSQLLPVKIIKKEKGKSTT